MSKEALVEKVKAFVETADDDAISRLEDFMEEESSEPQDISWKGLPDEVKADIQAGIAEADRGEGITWEAFKQQHSQWFPKLEA